MSKEFTPRQIRNATSAFLNSMRREFVRRNGPNAQSPIPNLENINSKDKGILLRSVKAALVAAENSEE